MNDEKPMDEDLELHRELWEKMMTNLSDTFEREARIADALVSVSEERRSGRAEAYRACAEAVIKAATPHMFIFPEPWIGYIAPVEASV